MGVELPAQATIRVGTLKSAHDALVGAVQSAGYTFRDRSATQISRGRSDGAQHFLYLLGGSGPLSGAYLSLSRPKIARFYRLEVSHHGAVHENRIGEVQSAVNSFVRNVEDLVNRAAGNFEPRQHPSRQRAETTVEMLDGTNRAVVSHMDPIAEALTFDQAVSSRLHEAADGTTVIARTISTEGVESLQRFVKLGSAVFVEDAAGAWTSRTLHFADGPRMTPPEPAEPPDFTIDPRVAAEAQIGSL
jgi:hypothetical protein